MTRRRRMQWIVVTTALAVVSLGLAAVMLSHRSPHLGLVDDRLRPCPDSPNCVCSFATDDEHTIAPLEAGNEPAATMNRLRDFLQSQSDVRLVTDDGPYVHTEFTTPRLRFVDDVEFLLDEADGLIHVRSASRVGHTDFGVNRKRVEMIRRRLTEDGT